MDVFFYLLLGMLVPGGYVLGIIGFFRANSAHTQVAALRRQVAELLARSPAPAEAAVAAAPMVEPAAVAGTRITPEPPVTAPLATPIPPEPPFAEPAAEPIAPRPAPRPAPKPSRDLEELLTARWGVWLGAAALLLAGVFLIRYAVERELLGPGTRCVMAALLGAALLAAAEWLTRHEPPSLPGPFTADQAPGALAAGGAAVLFGAAYGAGPYYDLLSPLLAFLAMAAASFVGLLAALRYGQVTAAVGIAGAFVTPALVSVENPSYPGLFVYLTVVSAAALAVVRYTAWTWLGWATTIAGAVWVCIAAFSGGTDLWAAAAFVPVAALLNLGLLPAAALDHPIGLRLAWIPVALIGAAGLLLETQLPGTAPRLALFALSPIAVWRGATEPRLDRLPWLAALFGLLTLLLWALPEWKPTGEVITVEDIVEAVLPGAWAPDVIRPLIFAATLFAAFHASVGLWQERRAPQPLHWAALVGAVPVLTLLVAYAQIARFQTDFRWAIVALALAAGLTVTAARAVAETARQRGGIHAAGAVAALALGCAMMLHNHWLTLAIALFLPALAWIEASADLPPLRQVALAVAALVVVRLVLNWYVLDYTFGTTPVANGLIAAYAAPAAAFAYAAMLFRRRADDLLVATLEAGAVTFAAFFVALEIRHGFNDGALVEPFSFDEVALHLVTLSVQATMYLYLAQRTARQILYWAAHVLGAIGLAVAIGLLVFNPALTGERVNVVSLLEAYLVPPALAVVALRLVTSPGIGRLLGVYALVGGFAWISLQIRLSFHPNNMSVIFGSIADAELWAWSGAWLAYGVALMVLGIRTEQRLLRLAALAVVALVCLKVFLIDMADLTGLWRVLSFLGLGLALIGLGVVHRRFVLPTQKEQPAGSG
ncbi:MAG: DUF2339 domain-containing protein [Acetobacteraceae bacterium]|jgi:uncharacterized membrane protein